MPSVKILNLKEVEAKEILGGPVKVVFNPETAKTKNLRFAVGCFGPGEGLKPHLHEKSEEVYYVVKGRGTVYLGKELKPINIEPETALYIPPKTIHCVKNTGEETLVIAFFLAPGEEKAQVIDEEI